MIGRVYIYSICVAFGLSLHLIIVGWQYADNPDNSYHRPSIENRRKRISSKVDSPGIKKILEETRSKIKYELYKYNFSQSGVHALEDLVIETGGRPLRSLIISTWRSGTTFLGELLNEISGTYYHYEPLLKYGIIQIREPPEADQALNAMKNMFKCNHVGLGDYFEYGRKHLNQFIHNTRLWNHCKKKIYLCCDAEFTSRLCKLFPFQTMKVVRLRLRLIPKLLDDKELNLKVIFLIRDPRGVMQSRLHRDFCKLSSDCWEPSLLCSDMISDYVAVGLILKQYPDRLMVVRYEELALKPNASAQRILKFLRLGATQSVDEFLRSHTNMEVGGILSTFRVSRGVPFKWKNALDYNFANKIQTVCKEAMTLWGYRMAHNKTHMTSKYFNPIENLIVS